MMLSDVCLSDVWRLSRTSGRRAECAAGRLDVVYWLIGPGSAGLAEGCPCALPLQAWAEAYRGGRPPTACSKLNHMRTIQPPYGFSAHIHVSDFNANWTCG